MSETLVLNYATGGLYARGQNRLREECIRQGYEGDFYLVNEDHPDFPSIPSFGAVPYGFKPHMMMKAKERGYRYLLWCDSSVFPVAPLERAFDLIKEYGYMFLQCGHNCGTWCSDVALEALGVDREDAFEIWQIIGGCQGIDVGTKELSDLAASLGPYKDVRTIGCQYLDLWYKHSNDGVSFQGSHTNENHQVSKDDRVRGHRHDQVVASIIAHQLGMKDILPNVAMYDESGVAPRKETIIFLIKSS